MKVLYIEVKILLKWAKFKEVQTLTNENWILRCLYIIVLWNQIEIVNIETILKLLAGQHSSKYERLAKIKSEDFPVKTSFEDFNFLLPFRGECEADFSRWTCGNKCVPEVG